jgi:hypothetical protein
MKNGGHTPMRQLAEAPVIVTPVNATKHVEPKITRVLPFWDKINVEQKPQKGQARFFSVNLKVVSKTRI